MYSRYLSSTYSLYSEFWKTRNETSNFYQRHEVELIKEEKRKIVELEVRLKVRQSNLLRVMMLRVATLPVQLPSLFLTAAVVPPLVSGGRADEKRAGRVEAKRGQRQGQGW